MKSLENYELSLAAAAAAAAATTTMTSDYKSRKTMSSSNQRQWPLVTFNTKAVPNIKLA
jgi:hypothetical protein